MYLRILSIVAALLFAAIAQVHSTVYDSDGTVANIQSIHNNKAVDGDTITIPAGTFSWTSRLDITKGITIKGQTTISGAGTAQPVIDDKTIILDNVVPRGQNSHLVKVTISTANQSFRFTGVTFKSGTETGVSSASAILVVANVENRKIRVDHCHIDQLRQGHAVMVRGGVQGVADHNVAKRRTDIGGTTCFYIDSGKYGNDPEGFGNKSWADYPWYGSNKFFFMENNTVEFGTSTDTSAGARFVYRYNYNINCNTGDHGSEGSYGRGQRCKEIYNNTFSWTGQRGPAVGTRGGSVLMHDNTVTGGTSNNPTIMANFLTYRETYAKASPFSTADGTNIWDANDTEGNNTFIGGHSPHLFDSGNASSTSAEGTVKDSTKHWTSNQWVGFSIKKPGSPYPYASAIKSNTATTITYDASHIGNNHLIFNSGDPYEIHRVVMPMDMAGGGGKSDLLQGSPIKNTTTGKASYGHPTLEPSYSWNNADGAIVLGFPPTEIVGMGKLGVHWFNLGNGFSSTPQAVRDKYNAALNGAQYTGTYVYPHPLTGVSPSPTIAPEASPSPSETFTPTPTATPSATPSATATSTATSTPTATPTAAPPDAPSGLSATATHCQEITLNWTDNSDNETGFKIERSPDNISFAQIGTVPENTTS